MPNLGSALASVSPAHSVSAVGGSTCLSLAGSFSSGSGSRGRVETESPRPLSSRACSRLASAHCSVLRLPPPSGGEPAPGIASEAECLEPSLGSALARGSPSHSALAVGGSTCLPLAGSLSSGSGSRGRVETESPRPLSSRASSGLAGAHFSALRLSPPSEGVPAPVFEPEAEGLPLDFDSAPASFRPSHSASAVSGLTRLSPAGSFSLGSDTAPEAEGLSLVLDTPPARVSPSRSAPAISGSARLSATRLLFSGAEPPPRPAASMKADRAGCKACLQNLREIRTATNRHFAMRKLKRSRPKVSVSPAPQHNYNTRANKT